MCSLSSSTIHSAQCVLLPVKQCKTGGQRWMYTCVNYMAVIAVWSPLESRLALEHLLRAYSEACLISCFYVCFTASCRACLRSVWQHNSCELQRRDAYIGRSWVFLVMHLANDNLSIFGRFDTNVDKLNLLVSEILVLWLPSPTLSSSLSSPWALYHCCHQYQLWTEYALKHLQSVACGHQILLKNPTPKIQFSTFLQNLKWWLSIP